MFWKLLFFFFFLQRRMENATVKDQLSYLPEQVIHHIMSFLSNKEATRFMALSKCLSSIWCSFPVLEFCPPISFLNHHHHHDEFLKSARDWSLERRRPVKSDFERLSFCMSYTNNDIEVCTLNLGEVPENLLCFAIEKKIRVLKLCCKESDIFLRDQKILSLPNDIFSSKTIKKNIFLWSQVWFL